MYGRKCVKLCADPCVNYHASGHKNAISHVGKIYNLLASIIAKNIVEEVEEVKEVTIKILAQIGMPIDKPQIVDIHFLEHNQSINNIKSKNELINEIVERNFLRVCDMKHPESIYQLCLSQKLRIF